MSEVKEISLNEVIGGGYSDFWKAGNGWCHCYKEAYACSTKIYLFENIPELKRWD